MQRVVIEVSVTNEQPDSALDIRLEIQADYKGQGQLAPPPAGAELAALWNGSTGVRIASVSAQWSQRRTVVRRTAWPQSKPPSLTAHTSLLLVCLLALVLPDPPTCT